MSSLKRAALGQGLGALLPPSRSIEGEKADKEIAIGQLHKNRYQPRKNFDAAAISELAQSLKESGMIQPIIVRPLLALDGAQQERLAASLAASGASAREAERQVKKLMKGPRRLPPPPDADQRAAEMALTRKLGCKVVIQIGKKGGQIIIKYSS